MTQKISIHTAGTCQGNPGPGGYCAIITGPGEEKRVRQGQEQQARRLEMSLQAVLIALETAQEMTREIEQEAGLGQTLQAVIHSDSKYIADAFGKNWVKGWKANGWKTQKGEELPGPQTWDRIFELSKGLELTWASLRGRNEDTRNNMADRMADEMAETQAQTGPDTWMNINIHVSGITHEDTQTGGYCAVISAQGAPDQMVRGGCTNTTSSRMKLQAISQTLQKTQEEQAEAADPERQMPRVRVHTRSRYIIETMNQGWTERWQKNGWLTNRGEQVKNQDLWEQILQNAQGMEINWIWSKGTQGNKKQETCYHAALDEINAREPIPELQAATA